jgi:hypothetical protein
LTHLAKTKCWVHDVHCKILSTFQNIWKSLNFSNFEGRKFHIILSIQFCLTYRWVILLLILGANESRKQNTTKEARILLHFDYEDTFIKHLSITIIYRDDTINASLSWKYCKSKVHLILLIYHIVTWPHSIL